MLRAIKSYWAFTSRIYKLIMLVLVPLVWMLLNSFFLTQGTVEETGSVLNGSIILLFVIDTMSDYFLLGGFYRKNNSALEFLQTSTKFSRVIREICIVDMFRRWICYQIPFVTALINVWGNEEKTEWCALFSYLPWAATLVAMLVVVVERHFVVCNQVYLCVVIGYAVLMILMLLFGASSIEHAVVINGIFIGLILFAGVGMICYTDRKVRDSYYDERYQTGM